MYENVYTEREKQINKIKYRNVILASISIFLSIILSIFGIISSRNIDMLDVLVYGVLFFVFCRILDEIEIKRLSL